MNNIRLKVIITLPLILIFAYTAKAQNLNADTSLTAQVLRNTRTYYNRQIADQSRLYNGIKYVDYKAGYIGDPYFLKNSFQNAYLRYDDVDFYDVPILYDLYRNMVVIENQLDSVNMSLLNSKLDKFIVSGHTFLRIVADSNQTKLKTGFYELLYNGKTELVAGHYKDIQEEKSDFTIKNVFYEHVNFYLLKGNVFYPVSGKNSMLDVLKDKKKEIQGYLKTEKLKFGDNPEYVMEKIAAYYDQLTK